MGAAALPAAIIGGSSLLGSLFGGGTKQQNQFVSFPGSDQLRDAYLNILLGPNPGGGSYWRQQGAGANSPLTMLNALAGGGPTQRTLDVAWPALTNILGSNTAASGLDALKPVFQQNLTDASNRLTATAPGGRFSSGMLQAQSGLNQKSLNDFNLLAANMLQEGIKNQLGAATTLGGLSSSAAGTSLDALRALLGPALSGTFGGTVLTQPSGLQQGLQAGGGLAQLLMLQQYLGQSGSPGTMTAPNVGGVTAPPMFGGGIPFFPSGSPFVSPQLPPGSIFAGQGLPGIGGVGP